MDLPSSYHNFAKHQLSLENKFRRSSFLRTHQQQIVSHKTPNVHIIYIAMVAIKNRYGGYYLIL